MGNTVYYVWLASCFPMGSEKLKKILDEWNVKPFYELDQASYRKIACLAESECKKLGNKSLEAAEKIMDTCVQKEISIVTYEDADYPTRLKNIYNPPCVLYYKGNIKEIDQSVLLAVVGTRNPSIYGQKTTGNLCYELSRSGVIIVSGCAAGIDSFAHAGALKAGKPTIAVLGCGLDVNYPSKNKALKESILDRGGALISEMPPGLYPTKSTFPIRNRLMTGISLGVVVMEAPMRSGALISAAHGLEQGKDIFCLPPHDIYNSRFEGVKSLIRDGAICLMSSLDVLEQYLFAYGHKLFTEAKDSEKVVVAKQDNEGFVLPVFAEQSIYKSHKNKIHRKNTKNVNEPKPIPQKQPLPDEYDETEKKIYEVLDFESKLIDDIITESNIDMQKALSILTTFEIAGIVVSYSGKRFGLRQEL